MVLKELQGTVIFLAEDEPKIADSVTEYFDKHGIAVTVAYDGMLAEKLIKGNEFDAYILDINMPYKNGLELCKIIRLKYPHAPILMLTAFSELEDKLDAFRSGADDYLVKPFHLDELNARIKALLKRSRDNTTDEMLRIDNMEINVSQKTVSRGGTVIDLTAKEYKLLELLAMAKGRTVSKQTIAEKVWDINFDTGTNTIEVYINFIRKKIDKDFPVKLLHTRPGFGYYLKSELS